MSVNIAGFEFQHVVYDSPVDILYLRVGASGSDRDWDESGEGDGVSYAADGSLNGFTLLYPKQQLDENGEVGITLPEQQVVATDLDGVLVARAA